MADGPKKITEEEVSLEQAKKRLLQDQLDTQLSFVESLKEALGVKTKLTESESTQLKLSKEIARLINSQDASLNSLAEKKKQIAKNEKLIAKGGIAQSLIDNKRVGRALELLKAQGSQAEKIAQMKADQIKSGEIDEQALKRADSYTESLDFQLDNIVKTLSLQEQAALYQQAGVENLKKTNEERKKEEEILENIQKSMGKTGAILAGVSKIPILGGLINSKEILEELEKSADKTGKKFVGIKKIFTAIGNEASRSMKDPAVAFGVGAKITKGLFDDIKSVVMMLDEFNGKLTKNFGISQKQAQDLNKEFLKTKSTADSEFVGD